MVGVMPHYAELVKLRSVKPAGKTCTVNKLRIQFFIVFKGERTVTQSDHSLSTNVESWAPSVKVPVTLTLLY